MVKLIVANNPGAVRRNLLQSGLVGQNFQLTPEGFMQLLSGLPEQIVGTREQAIGFVTTMLNVQIDPQGVGGNQLIGLSQNFGQPLNGIIQQVFEQNMPAEMPINLPNQQSTCGCKHADSIDGKQATILVFAALGILFVIVILVKMFLKILQ